MEFAFWLLIDLMLGFAEDYFAWFLALVLIAGIIGWLEGEWKGLWIGTGIVASLALLCDFLMSLYVLSDWKQ